VITAHQLGFRYPERRLPALSDLSFSVRAGESVLVLGSSGSGKSTLALCLDGLIPQVVEGEFAGELTVAGLSTSAHAVSLLAQKVGLVFQDPEAQFCTLSVEDEIAFGLENLRTPPELIEGKIEAVLARVGLAGLRARRLETLSGGEQQRVALASVLALEPEVLVLDEPSANLDPAGTRELFALLGELAARREHTLIVIEHKLDEIIAWVESVIVLAPDGSLLFRGDPREAFYERAALLADAGVWRPQRVAVVQGLRGRGWAVPGSPLSLEETVTALEATPGLLARLAAAPPASALPQSGPEEVLLAVRDLSFSYPKGAEVLKAVSFEITAGEFTVIVGANGAGKSTLASLLSGVRRPPRGTVYLRGSDIRTLSDAALTAQVGHVFQNPEHQLVADSVHGELAYSLSQSKHGKLSAEQEATVAATLQRFGLERLAEANPYTLSQGQKRRLSVAAMLVRAQPVLVLDEPTFGQDYDQALKLMDLLSELWRQGSTIVVVTHDMNLAAQYAQQLLVLDRGELRFCGPPGEFFAAEELVTRASLGRPPLAELAAALAREQGRDLRLLTLNDFFAAAGLAGEGQLQRSTDLPERCNGVRP
jgi:energy-coupling factor transporter ATP-binding protein EcfA2